MPLYSYACPNCGWGREDIRCIAQRHDAPKCDRCKQKMQLIVAAPVFGVVKNPAVPKS